MNEGDRMTELMELLQKLMAEERRAEAIRLLEGAPEVMCDEGMLMQLGELLYAEGRMTDALNRFNAVLRIEPENRKAAGYVTMIRNILDYYNKDLLNP